MKQTTLRLPLTPRESKSVS